MAETAFSSRAYIYGRYSSHAQKDTSIEQQFADIRIYCRENNIQIIGEYADRALSGTTDKRPEFQRMLRDAAKGRADCVVCWKVDRFARNRYDSAMYKNKLRKCGVRVLYAKESIPDGPEGILLESILEGSAEYYSANLAQNVRRGLMANAAECKVNSGAIPLGYCRGSDGRHAIDPKGAAIVREVFRLFNSGMRIVDICAQLNVQGLRTSKGSLFNKNSLRVMLRNEKYIGVYKYADVRVEGGMPVIISKDEFEKAQQLLVRHAKAPASSWGKAEYLLTGKLFCGHCKSAMIGEVGTSKSGVQYNYYVCAARKLKSGSCDKKRVRKELIEERIVAETVNRILVPGVMEEIAEAVVALQAEERKSGELPLVRRQLADVEKTLRNVMAAIEQGIITQTTRARMLELEEQREQLSARIDQLNLETPDLNKEQIMFWFSRFLSGDPADPEFQRTVIDAFLVAAYLYDDKLKVVLRVTSGHDEQIDLPLILSEGNPGSGAECSHLVHGRPPKCTKTNTTSKIIVFRMAILLEVAF